MDRYDGVVRWSPNSANDHFISINISSRILQSYKVEGHVRPDLFEYKKLAEHNDVPQLTAYDWSPKIDDLVAIGTGRGEVHLLRVDGSNDSTVIPVKLQRQCQSVSFNNTGLLAVGLDRVRNDFCLQIWDINQRLDRWDPSKPGWQSPSKPSEPLRKLEASVPTTSVRFFEDQPQTLVVGLKNSNVRIHDLRDPNGTVISFNTRACNNLAIDYADSNYFASSSLDSPGVMVWDRRATDSSTVGSMYAESLEAKEVPWGAALKLNTVINDKNGSWIKSLRFNRDQRGVLGILSNAGELKVYDLRKEYIDDEIYTNPPGSPELLEVRKSQLLEGPNPGGANFQDRVVSFDWLTLSTPNLQSRMIALRGNGNIDIIETRKPRSELLMSMANFSGPSYEQQAHFQIPVFPEPHDFSQILGPLYQSHDPVLGKSNQSPLMSTETATAQAIQQAFDNQRNLPVRPLGYTRSEKIADRIIRIRAQAKNIYDVENSSVDTTDANKPVDAAADAISKLAISSGRPLSSRERHQISHYTSIFPQNEEELKLLAEVRELRADEGYLFNCKKNKKIVADDPWLQDVWEWIGGAKLAAKSGDMMSDSLDLSYLGVHAIWTRKLGAKAESRLIDRTEIPSPAEWEKSIAIINKKAGRAKMEGIKTAWPQSRSLCLAICGYGRSAEEFNTSLDELQAKGLYTKAAAWALFEGIPNRAVDILKTAGGDLMFTALSLDLQLKTGAKVNNSEWDSAFQGHKQMKEDPYLRAIYGLISTGDWKSIADETSLPLRDRIGVALRNFDDKQLTAWLNKQMDEAIKTGDIEAIILAGINDDMMDVLSKYVEVLGDYQTAVLIMSFGVPLYISDYRYDHWKVQYDEFLRMHQDHILSTRFFIESKRLSQKRDGVPTIKPAPRAVSVRCVYCEADIPQSTIEAARPSESANVQRPRNPLFPTGIHAGIECPKCGRHLPRCTWCEELMGLPRTDRMDLDTIEQQRLARMLMFCAHCGHGMHLDHGSLWFAANPDCAEEMCKCLCKQDPYSELVRGR